MTMPKASTCHRCGKSYFTGFSSSICSASCYMKLPNCPVCSLKLDPRDAVQIRLADSTEAQVHHFCARQAAKSPDPEEWGVNDAEFEEYRRKLMRHGLKRVFYLPMCKSCRSSTILWFCLASFDTFASILNFGNWLLLPFTALAGAISWVLAWGWQHGKLHSPRHH